MMTLTAGAALMGSTRLAPGPCPRDGLIARSARSGEREGTRRGSAGEGEVSIRCDTHAIEPTSPDPLPLKGRRGRKKRLSYRPATVMPSIRSVGALVP